MTPESLADLEAKLGAMTEGPWAEPYEETNPGDQGWWVHNGKVGSDEHAIFVTFVFNPNGQADAEGIATLRNNASELLRLARRGMAAEKAIERLRPDDEAIRNRDLYSAADVDDLLDEILEAPS